MSPRSTPHPTPHTPRIYLELLSAEKHLHDFHSIFTNPAAVQWSVSPPATSLQESLERMEKILAPPAPNPTSSASPATDDMYVNFAVMLLHTSASKDGEEAEAGKERDEEREGDEKEDKMIGIIGTNRFREQGLEIGYCFNIDFWGKGYATEALRMFLSFMWNRPEIKHLPTLCAKSSPGNTPSHNVLLKCGARKGELLKAVYPRWMIRPVLGDAQVFYFDRPMEEL